MKTFKSMTFKQIILLLNCLVMCMLPVLLSAQVNQKQYKFTNDEDEAATDLHIEFKKAVTFVVPNPNPNADVTTQDPSGTFPEGNGSGSSEINLANGFTGTAVPEDGSVVFTFGYTGNNPPDVKKWWWTNDNNVDPNTGRIGLTKNPRKGEFDFISVEPSTGDGSILLNIDGVSNTFEIPPGLSNTDLALALKSFVEDQFEFGEALILDGTKVEVFSRAHRNEIDDIFVNITPDSTMAIEWTYIPEVIPTLSEWGVIILILLTLAMGMVFLYRRETSLALAGNIQAGTPISNPKLFNKHLYAKVFGVVLLIGFALLGLSYGYFGEITSADPFGIFISSAIVAYMVHFWMLRKSQSE